MGESHRNLDGYSFQEYFSNEDACRDHLFKLRWPDGFRCPRCNCDNAYFLKNRLLYQCTSCKFQTSLTAGTIMHKTRTPLVKWFLAIYLVSADKRNLSALALSSKLDIGIKCAMTMLHRIRKALKARKTVRHLTDLLRIEDALFGGSRRSVETRRGRLVEKMPAVARSVRKMVAVTTAPLAQAAPTTPPASTGRAGSRRNPSDEERHAPVAPETKCVFPSCS